MADSLGLLVCHSDLDLHRELAPSEPLERVVFDLLEQLRCESLRPTARVGMEHNLDAAFGEWSEQCLGERIAESGVGLLVSVTHMARTRLVRSLTTEVIDEVTEGQRFALAPLIGEDLVALRANRHDQRAFAFPRPGDRRGGCTRGRRRQPRRGRRGRRPFDAAAFGMGRGRRWRRPHGRAGATSARVADLDDLGDYQVFTRAFDREVGGDALVAPNRLPGLRAELDRHRKAQAVSAARVAQRLIRALARPAEDGWTFAEDDGELDPARLAMIITDPVEHRVFRRRVSARSPMSL